MTFRTLRLLAWMAVFLAAGEVALETRAWRHGWGTILFGRQRATILAAGPDTMGFGPSSEFPFRSRIVPVSKPGHTLRVWISSASMAEDLSVPPTRIFPGLIAAELSRVHVASQVLNASRSGVLIRENEAMLEKLGPVWRPDVAVLYQMNLDINELSQAYLGGEKAHIVAAEKTAAEPTGSAPAGPELIVRWIERTTTFEQLRAQITSRVSLNRPLRDGLPPGAEEDFRKRIDDWITAAEAVHARPILCTFATSRDREHAHEIPNELALWMLRWNIYLAPEGWLRTVERLNQIIREVAHARGAAVVDAETAMAGRPQYFKDFVHFTPEGHAQLATLISDALEQRQRPNPDQPVSGGR